MAETIGFVIVEYGPTAPNGHTYPKIISDHAEAEKIIAGYEVINQRMGFEGISYKIYELEATLNVKGN